MNKAAYTFFAFTFVIGIITLSQTADVYDSNGHGGFTHSVVWADGFQRLGWILMCVTCAFFLSGVICTVGYLISKKLDR
ncbi:MAG: hypothetical protein ACO1NM_08105 [Sphingobium phenoxybenzoativorans]